MPRSLTILNPHGIVALQERDLIIHAVLLMLIVIVPVFVLLFFMAWRYRANRQNSAYSPNWEHSKLEELIWWAVPFEIVLVLAALTWSSTHALDPSKTLTGNTPPMKVQVVALQWKWLFIYPEEGIASVNEVEFPANRAIEFDITADAPMNSFWIPALGGQIYAMTGMITKLNLESNTLGSFRGSSANYSGEGFAQMRFTANAISDGDFGTWVQRVKRSTSTLDATMYDELAKPSDAGPAIYYASVDKDLFDKIVMKFMMPKMQMQRM
jgi:cytochrome o ubiquinol oxidase subunit 2